MLDLKLGTVSKTIFIPASSDPDAPGGSNTFEYVSKNIRSHDNTLNYTGKDLTSIVYDLGGGFSITKTFNYTMNDLTSIVLSGDTPAGIDLTKTLTYTVKDLTGITYS